MVRAQAASSLEFLQEPSPQCPVTNALLGLLEKDSSPEVRRTILNKIAVSNRTLSGEAPCGAVERKWKREGKVERESKFM